VRYANEINVKVELDLTGTEAIYRPYVIIDYKETKKSFIGTFSTTPTTFTMEYFMNYSDRMSGVYAGLGVLVALSVIWAGIQLMAYNRRNQSS
jgi:hypothetical protein